MKNRKKDNMTTEKTFAVQAREFGFEYDRTKDLYEAMKTIHRLVSSRDDDYLKIMDQYTLGSALIDVAEGFGKLDGRGTSHNFRTDGKRWCIK
jgi:hypothetical protein